MSAAKKTRSLKQYDISDYTIKPGFMTDLEIKDMYKKLQFHMKVKYGMYDNEVIHRTIIRGLHKADMYDPKKASKIVWFQSILYFYWIQQRSPEYNHSNTDISLSTSMSNNDPDFTFIETIDNKEEEWKDFGEEGEEKDYTEDVAKFIVGLLSTGSYPLLKMRADGLTYREIRDKTGLSTPTITGRLFAERNLMRDEVLSTAKGKEVISKRVSITRWVFGKKHKVVLSGQDRICSVCNKGFVFAGGNSMRIFCSDDCRTIHKLKVEKARVRAKKIRDPNKPDKRHVNPGRPKNKPKEDNGNI